MSNFVARRIAPEIKGMLIDCLLYSTSSSSIKPSFAIRDAQCLKTGHMLWSVVSLNQMGSCLQEK